MLYSKIGCGARYINSSLGIQKRILEKASLIFKHKKQRANHKKNCKVARQLIWNLEKYLILILIKWFETKMSLFNNMFSKKDIWDMVQNQTIRENTTYYCPLEMVWLEFKIYKNHISSEAQLAQDFRYFVTLWWITNSFEYVDNRKLL